MNRKLCWNTVLRPLRNRLFIFRAFTMKCIFCEQESTASKSVEHIIPESLGNLSTVLPRGIVCDKCNNYFARKVEGPFLGSDVMRRLRQELEIKTKNGKFITAFDYPRVGKEYVKQISKDDYLIYTQEEKTQADLTKMLQEYQECHEETDRALLVYNEYVARFLAKAAIEYFVYRCGSVNEVCEYVRTDAVFKSLREYARYGNHQSWPYNVRRIYSRNEAYKGDPFSSIAWEADFLFLGNGEIYFVVVIHGIEYSINMLIPSSDGYKKWLNENLEQSPLHISEGVLVNCVRDYIETMFSEAEKEELKSYFTKHAKI